MNLLEALQNLEFPIVNIIQQPIIDDLGNILAWNSYAQNQNGISIAGGTHENADISKRIVVAESFERALSKKIFENPIISKNFLMDTFPSTCGFACGFESESTKFRSIREAIERWAWSKWIDESFKINEYPVNIVSKTSLIQFITKQFNNVRVFRKDGLDLEINSKKLSYSFVVMLLETDSGVFPGCRAGLPQENLYTHATIEAYRNYQNYKISQRNPKLSTESIIAKRTKYFATNKLDAFRIIDQCQSKPWEKCELLISMEYKTNILGVYLWRSLMKNFTAWHLGDEKRFVI